MRSKPLSILLLAASLWALATAPAGAEAVETLLLQVSLESELLEDAFRRYRTARDAERLAMSELTDLSTRLDGLLNDANRPVEELRGLENELIEASEIATARLRRTAMTRLELYDRRERLFVLERRLAEIGGGPLVPDTGISGLWQVEIEPESIFGLMRIQAEGTLLTGTYVLSNGDQGSIRGTVVDNKVEVQRIDASLGFIATLEGRLDAAGGQIDGSWTATAVSSGNPTTGTWTGRRLARSLSVRPSG